MPLILSAYFFLMIRRFIFLSLQKQAIQHGRFLFLMLLLISCRELIEEPFPDFNAVPVLNALLIEGDTLSVNISMAEKLDTMRLGFVDLASVELFVNDQFVEILNYTNEGEYTSTTVIEASKKYTCKVAVPGHETITCEQFVPATPRIINVKHINIAGKNEEGTSFPAIELTFENKPEIRSYYEIAIYLLKESWDSIYFRETYIEAISDPVLLNEGLAMALFSNELITDSVYTMHINYTTGLTASSNGGPIKTVLFPLLVELRQTTEDYYRYKKQLYLYENGLEADGVLTSMTNNNLYSNIHKAYGIYAAYSAVFTDTITPIINGDDDD